MQAPKRVAYYSSQNSLEDATFACGCKREEHIHKIQAVGFIPMEEAAVAALGNVELIARCNWQFAL